MTKKVGVILSRKSYEALKKIAIGGGRNWEDVMTDDGRFVVSLDEDVYERIKADVEGILSRAIDCYDEL